MIRDDSIADSEAPESERCQNSFLCYTDPVFYGECFMANLTLSLDDGLLQKSREAALREHTSVNALVREYLVRYVDAKSRRLEALDTLDALAGRSASASSEAWTRDTLHERKAD